MTAYMLDAMVFDRLADGGVSFDAFRGLRLLATHVQWDELNAAKEKYPVRAAKLLAAFEKIDPSIDPTASAFFDVSKWGQSSWSAEDGVEQQMLQRLTQIDAEEGKKHRPKNQRGDILIGHTAIKNNATLISDDDGLRRLVSEFGGRAI